jgi:hypothetical protein
MPRPVPSRARLARIVSASLLALALAMLALISPTPALAEGRQSVSGLSEYAPRTMSAWTP